MVLNFFIPLVADRQDLMVRNQLPRGVKIPKSLPHVQPVNLHQQASC